VLPPPTNSCESGKKKQRLLYDKKLGIFILSLPSPLSRCRPTLCNSLWVIYTKCFKIKTWRPYLSVCLSVYPSTCPLLWNCMTNLEEICTRFQIKYPRPSLILASKFIILELLNRLFSYIFGGFLQSFLTTVWTFLFFQYARTASLKMPSNPPQSTCFWCYTTYAVDITSLMK
jgi:hypothetical protein